MGWLSSWFSMAGRSGRLATTVRLTILMAIEFASLWLFALIVILPPLLEIRDPPTRKDWGGVLSWLLACEAASAAVAILLFWPRLATYVRRFRDVGLGWPWAALFALNAASFLVRFLATMGGDAATGTRMVGPSYDLGFSVPTLLAWQLGVPAGGTLVVVLELAQGILLLVGFVILFLWPGRRQPGLFGGSDASIDVGRGSHSAEVRTGV